MKFYIKERNNPQFSKPYYVAKGQMTKKASNRLIETVYGYNTLLSFDSEEEYLKAIDNLKETGFRVQ
jgi:hypothetical protein